MTRRVSAALILLLRFLWQVLVSGLETAKIVLRPGAPPPTGLIRMDFVPMSETGAAILACLVTLTPGTTVVDIDLEGHEMLLHLLDVSNADAAVASIRDEFERPLSLIFGQPERRS